MSFLATPPHDAAVKSGMDLRRYQLVTLAAARRLRSTHCAQAHGAVLRQRFDGELRRIAADHRRADLEPADVAVTDVADNAAADATSITAADLSPARRDLLTVGRPAAPC